MASLLASNTIRLWTRDTPAGHDTYTTVVNERVPRTQTSTWDRRVVTGPVSADGEQYLSTWSQDDYSGGFGIRDANETTDTSRIEFGIIDGRHPKNMCLPPLTTTPAKPAWASGSAWPLGDIGETFYTGWSTGGVAGWDNANQTWFSTQNTWPTGFAPVNEPVAFGGALFVPGGTEGTCILTESNSSTGALSKSHLTGVQAVVFGLWDDKLWAIDTDNHLWMLTALGAEAGAGTLSNWGDFQVAAGTYTGTEKRDVIGNVFQLNKGVVPTTLIQWFNSAGEEALWCITRGKGAFVLAPDEPRWVQAKIKPGTHPDWGIDAEVFRDGEDMFIAGGGLDVTRETTGNAEVPLSGISKDQGVPAQYQGTIVDLLSERSTLYALVQAGHSVAEGTPTAAWVNIDTFGTYGTGPGQFSTPYGIAVQSDGKVWVANLFGKTVQRFTAAGVYDGASISTFYYAADVCVDSSNNVYVLEQNTAGGDGRLRKFSPSLALLWNSEFSGSPRGCCTDDTYVYVATQLSTNPVRRFACSNGVATTGFGSAGSGNGQFVNAEGITHDGTYLYVSETGNGGRIQKLQKSNGTYVAKWTSTDTYGLAVDGSGRIWATDYGRSQLRRYSNTGTLQVTLSQSTPRAIAVASGDKLYAASGQNTVSIWDEDTITTPAIPSKTWLGAWTGTAWCGLWESDGSIAPTWMRLSLKGDYALWWGDASGTVYRQLLPDPFFNPAARVELGVYPFAASGWMQTVRYDANMGGWDKIASHFFAMMDYASADCYVDLYYRTDADQFTSGDQNPPWRPWKRVDHIGRTLCRFDDTEVDPISGETWREGEAFQWIQFRYEFHRGIDTFKSPLWMWHSLHHLTNPQDSETFRFKVPIAKAPPSIGARSPNEIVHTIFGLQTVRKMVHLQTRNPDPDHPEWRVFFRGRVTGVKSESYSGADNNIAEVVVFDFVGIGESSNQYTTLGVDIPA